MRNKIILTFSILMLFAISVKAQKGYESAKEVVKIGGKNIAVKSQIYINLMPGIVSGNPNEKTDCSKTGKLIAPVTIETENGTRLPKKIVIKRIWIKNNDEWRQINFNKDEFNAKESSIYAVARDCPNGNFNVDKNIVVAVELKYQGKTYFIRSNQTKVEKVY